MAMEVNPLAFSPTYSVYQFTLVGDLFITMLLAE